MESLATLVEAVAPTLQIRDERAAVATKKKKSTKKAAAVAADGSKLEDEEDDDEEEMALPRIGGLIDVLDVASMATLAEMCKPSLSATRALTRIAAWLPAEAVPELSRDCLRQLGAQPNNAAPARLGPLLACACAWDLDGPLLDKIAEALGGTPKGPDAVLSSAGKKRNKRGQAADAASPPLAQPLALRVLWVALSAEATREVLLERQSQALTALLPLLAKRAATAGAASGGSSSDTTPATEAEDALRALSCYVQLSWHLAANAGAKSAAASAAAAGTGGEVGGNKKRQTKAEKAKAEALAAEAAAKNAKAAGSKALELVIGWTGPEGASPRRGNMFDDVEENVELTPGQARPKTRPRTILGDDENAGDNNSPLKALGGGKEVGKESTTPAALAARVLGCAWLAEGGMLGLIDSSLAEKAVSYVLTSVRLAAKDMEASSSVLTQLLPHVAKMIVHLFEALPPKAPENTGVDGAVEAPATPTAAAALRDQAETSARLHHLGTDLLFGLLHSAAGSEQAAKMSKPLLLETLLLAQHQPTHRLDLLVHRLLTLVLKATSQAAEAAIAAGARDDLAALEGGCVGILDLPPLTSEVAHVLTLRSAGVGASLLPAIDTTCKQAFAAADAPKLRACLAYLLACEGLRRPELPGRSSLKRSLEGLAADCKAAATAAAAGGAAAASGRVALLPEAALIAFGELAAPVGRLATLMADTPQE